MTSDPVCIWPLGAILGEGPVWVARDRALWFTDIKRRKLHRFDPASEQKRSWDAPSQPGFVHPARGGGLVVGLQTGLHLFDPASATFEFLTAPEPDRPGNRLNDATVAPDGSLWFGSMDDGETVASGAFYRLEPDGHAVRMGGECAITNGPVLSPHGSILYHVDSLARAIDRYDVAPNGTISNRRRFATIAEADGYPDGPTVDCEGHVWIGLWGGWRARRYAPDGSISAEVRFPVANVTKLAFGGPDFATAFVTTASQGLDDAALAEQPLAGGLFAFTADVPGLPGHEVSIGI